MCVLQSPQSCCSGRRVLIIYSPFAVQHRHPVWPHFPQFILPSLTSHLLRLFGASPYKFPHSFVALYLLSTLPSYRLFSLCMFSPSHYLIATLPDPLLCAPWPEEEASIPLNSRDSFIITTSVPAMALLTNNTHLSRNEGPTLYLFSGLYFSSRSPVKRPHTN